MKVAVYTDGGCDINKKGARNKGGHASCLFFEDGRVILHWGQVKDTTNNIMELMGAIRALQILSPDDDIVLMTDSQYVQKGMTEWMTSWVKKEFDGVANAEYWQKLYELSKERTVEWKWVRGHSGVVGNELADRLCNLAMFDSNPPCEYRYEGQFDLSKQRHSDVANTFLNTSDFLKNCQKIDPKDLPKVTSALNPSTLLDGLFDD